ncbi:hypothetical protein B0J14DRAFT_621569 [Halenospora varia]|nr:hypothetical protein B0J14DRAFT_621569 [Halenospora varia]
MRDTIESQDGLIYSQFYALIKTPFDTSKVYVFDNKSLENLALDPRYIRSLYKERAYTNLDLYDDEIDAAPSLPPYYIVPTKELLAFLYAQINKYCFLFEHVLTHTAIIYLLPETIVIVTALRALRLRNEKSVVKEGLGIRKTIERCGLGWFLPKIN